MASSSDPLLAVQGLTTVFDVDGRPLRAVDEVSFEVRAGETLGLVGESGSGKSMTALLDSGWCRRPGGSRRAGAVRGARSPGAAANGRCAGVRGAGIAMIFQEPMTALNPVFTVGDQIAEALLVHGLAAGRGRAPGGRAAARGAHARAGAPGRATTRTNSPAACASG